MVVDYKNVIKFIFSDKDSYQKLSDEDKENTFFMVNRKLARGLPKYAQYFNQKNTDKASAMDVWFNFFIKKRTTGIPEWYWTKKKEDNKEKRLLTEEEIKFIMEIYQIKRKDVEFLENHFKEDLIEEIKKIRKLNKKQVNK
jgi:hypothetical protein